MHTLTHIVYPFIYPLSVPHLYKVHVQAEVLLYLVYMFLRGLSPATVKMLPKPGPLRTWFQG